jgi:hypothetical protein
MFVAAVSMIAKFWNQSRYPSVDEWINEMLHIYTIEPYSVIKLLLAGKLIELEIMMLSEISQIQKDKYCMFSLVQNLD